MLNYCTPTDIANRIFRKKRHWKQGPPTIGLAGNEGAFGELRFDFKDEVVSYTIFIKNRKVILDTAEDVIQNFSIYVQKIILMNC